MHSIPLIATTTDNFAHSHSVMDALPHLGGMLMVLCTLLVLWGLTVLISKCVAFIQPKSGALVSQQPEQKVNATPVDLVHDEGIAPEIVAIIAAAVASYISSPHRVISIKPVSTSWERAGRQSVLTSHRIR